MGFILDFYCHEAKLAIEIDGGGHLEEEQKRYDLERTNILNDNGIKVLRFFNNEVIRETENVILEIWKEASLRQEPSP